MARLYWVLMLSVFGPMACDAPLDPCPYRDLVEEDAPCDCQGETFEGFTSIVVGAVCEPDGLVLEGIAGDDAADLATCPEGELTGDELPCDCQGETVEALPGDGSSCVCDEAGFHCD